ncbi:MAG TPA: hypothetical protein VEI07_04380, partial [Planctomycetaceae bacterium]|nr:hypothetical protein [Planctomycetaceae bacterium]
RFLMRLSLGSVGVLTAVLLIAFAFWPDNKAVRGPEQLIAQEKPKVEGPKGEPAHSGKRVDKGNPHSGNQPTPRQPLGSVRFLPVDHPLSSDLARQPAIEARITEALNQAIDFSIGPQSLKDAVDFIATRYGIPILFDQKALEDANVDTSTEVHLDAPGISLRDALQLIFGQLSSPLGYDVVHGVLMITTVDKINDHLETIVYDCRDLVNIAAPESAVMPDHVPANSKDQPGAKNRHAEKTNDRFRASPPFIRIVTAATDSESWGEGASISELGGLMIVRQNPRMHEQIKALLASIRLMRKEGAFAVLNDQYESDAKKQTAEQSGLAARVAQLEHELAALRTTSTPSAKPWTPPPAK